MHGAERHRRPRRDRARAARSRRERRGHGYFTEHLQFNADGTFVRNAVASGTGPVVDWASVPPADRGTYEVGADGLLRLAFADGKLRAETIGVFLADDGTPKSPTEGIVLDSDGYFDISEN